MDSRFYGIVNTADNITIESTSISYSDVNVSSSNDYSYLYGIAYSTSNISIESTNISFENIDVSS